MKKYLFIAIAFIVAWLSFSATVTGSSPSTTYKRILFLEGDSLTSTLSAIQDGAGNTTPLEMSTAGLQLSTNKYLWLYGTNNYLRGTSANNVEMVAGSDLTFTATNLYLGSSNNYITGDDLTIGGNITGVDGTFTGDVAITGDATVDSVYAQDMLIWDDLDVTDDLTVSGTITGDLTGDVTSSETSSFATVSTSGTLTCSGAGTGLTVANNVNIDGTLTVDLTSTLTGVVTADGGVVGNLTGNVTGTTFTDSGSGGVAVDGVTLKDGDIQLKGLSNYIAFDEDNDTYMYSGTDDIVYFKISNADDFRFAANKLTALSGSSIETNIIAEATADSGVTVDGCLFESQTNSYNIYAPSGQYLSLSSSDDPQGHSLSDRTDLYIGGKLEVDGYTWIDGSISIANGETLTLYDMDFEGTSPEINATAVESGSGHTLSVVGGENTGGAGGALYLDGGDGTTADGNIIIGNSDGNLDIKTHWAESDYELKALSGNVTDALAYQTSIYTTTTADTVTIGGTPFSGMIKQYIAKSVGGGSVYIEAGTYDCTLDAAGETVRYKYIDSVWYIIGKNN